MNVKKKWIAGIILLCILISGIAMGSAGTLLVLKKRLPPRPPVASVFGLKKDHYVDFVVKRMTRTLELSNEQSVAIKKEMKLLAQSFRSLHAKTGEEMDRIMKKGHLAIRTHLSQEQIKKFEAEIARKHLRRKERHRKIKKLLPHESVYPNDHPPGLEHHGFPPPPPE